MEWPQDCLASSMEKEQDFDRSVRRLAMAGLPKKEAAR
jgi:hypothetical protein